MGFEPTNRRTQLRDFQSLAIPLSDPDEFTKNFNNNNIF